MHVCMYAYVSQAWPTAEEDESLLEVKAWATRVIYLQQAHEFKGNFQQLACPNYSSGPCVSDRKIPIPPQVDALYAETAGLDQSDVSKEGTVAYMIQSIQEVDEDEAGEEGYIPPDQDENVQWLVQALSRLKQPLNRGEDQPVPVNGAASSLRASAHQGKQFDTAVTGGCAWGKPIRPLAQDTKQKKQKQRKTSTVAVAWDKVYEKGLAPRQNPRKPRLKFDRHCSAVKVSEAYPGPFHVMMRLNSLELQAVAQGGAGFQGSSSPVVDTRTVSPSPARGSYAAVSEPQRQKNLQKFRFKYNGRKAEERKAEMPYSYSSKSGQSALKCVEVWASKWETLLNQPWTRGSGFVTAVQQKQVWKQQEGLLAQQRAANKEAANAGVYALGSYDVLP